MLHINNMSVSHTNVTVDLVYQINILKYAVIGYAILIMIS